MSDFVFNQAKGRIAYYASLPATNDALIVIPLETSGIVSDATMIDYDDVATLLAGATNEQSTMGRKTVTSGVTVTVDDTNDRVDIDMPDLTWTGAAGNAISALLVAYDPDTTSGTDSSLVPLCKLDCALTPDGSDFTAQIAAAGFMRAA